MATEQSQSQSQPPQPMVLADNSKFDRFESEPMEICDIMNNNDSNISVRHPEETIEMQETMQAIPGDSGYFGDSGDLGDSDDTDDSDLEEGEIQDTEQIQEHELLEHPTPISISESFLKLAELSIKICYNSETKTCHYAIDHIKQIDNVQCNATITIKYNTNMNCYHFTFRIRPLEICDLALDIWCYYMYYKHRVIGIDGIAKELQRVHSTIPMLKFDRYSGNFKDPERLELVQCIRNAFLIENEPNITTRIDMCSICQEPTMTHTKCKHYICVPCADESIANSYKDCPICRSIDELDVLYGPPESIPGMY